MNKSDSWQNVGKPAEFTGSTLTEYLRKSDFVKCFLCRTRADRHISHCSSDISVPNCIFLAYFSPFTLQQSSAFCEAFKLSFQIYDSFVPDIRQLNEASWNHSGVYADAYIQVWPFTSCGLHFL